MEEAIRNSLAQESIQKMKHPAIFMHPDDLKKFIENLELKCNVITGENPKYQGIPIYERIQVKRGVFHVWDFIPELISEQQNFKEYLKEARQSFCKEVNKHNVSDNLKLRTEIDSFLIAFDQLVDRLKL
jgi:hypothetical protein